MEDDGSEEGEDELEAEPSISSPVRRTIRIPRPERSDIFDLQPSPVQDDGEDYNQAHDVNDEAAESQLVGEQDSFLVNGVSDGSMSNGDADGLLQPLNDQGDTAIPNTAGHGSSSQAAHQDVEKPVGRRRGRPRKSDPDSSLLQPDSNSKSASVGRSQGMVNGVVTKGAKRKETLKENEREKITPSGKTVDGKSKKSKDSPALRKSNDNLASIGENEVLDDSFSERNESTMMHVDESRNQDPDDNSKNKKRLHNGGDDSVSQKKRKRQSLPPPSQRSANAKVSGVKVKKSSNAKDSEKSKYRADEVPTRPKSSHIIRQGTPMDEPGAHVTRYGRASFKPLAWYRGEGVRWSQRSSRDELPGVQEIVRVEDTLPLPVKRPKKRGRKRKGSVMSTVDEAEEELEDWEQNDGFLMGTAYGWDSIEDDVTNEDEDLCKLAEHQSVEKQFSAPLMQCLNDANTTLLPNRHRFRRESLASAGSAWR